MGPLLTRPVRVADAGAGGPSDHWTPRDASPTLAPRVASTVGFYPGRRMSLEFVPSSPSSHGGALAPALSANVLVLNKFYQAIRVVNVRRAFSMLCRDMAEVVHIETDPATGQARWQNYDFD